jgi:hypothetical protein
MSCDLGWIPYLYGYVDYAFVMGFGEIRIWFWDGKLMIILPYD